ncbi:MAG: tyrosine-type recombinase/integrase [Acidimicrobiaceae bacterium]|nr:tyrosine-type recombinase/integrase [Acidimicrobiaceae bacterium]MXZ52392.1 tyrosine-type recombinase/integrase [Acidimicrobiaceae bacterium]MYB87565.1 tyrosine-type recombinase/integrase [Acidimicrobiaceae bacterium]MYH92986.1 tyrosine-type recombinase/integrase [Acidimicrobiaceae bacterium]
MRLLTLVLVSQSYRRTGGVHKAPGPVTAHQPPHHRPRSPTPSHNCGWTDGASSESGWPPVAATRTATSSQTGRIARPPDLSSQTFERLPATLDLSRIRLHHLRHAHATILLPQGVNSQVSERLRHASVSFTMDLYQHVRPGMQPSLDAHK